MSLRVDARTSSVQLNTGTSSSGSMKLSSSSHAAQPGEKTYTVTLMEAPERGCFERWRAIVGECVSSWLSPTSWMGMWKGYWADDWSQGFIQAWKPGSFLSRIPTPRGTLFVTAHADVMKEVFTQPRKSNKKLFWDVENEKLFIKGLFKQLFAEELRELGEDAANALVMTAEFSHVGMLRRPYLAGLGPKAISGMEEEIRSVANELLKGTTEAERRDCNMQELTFEFAVAVVAKVFLGLAMDRKKCQEMVKVLETFGQRMTSIVSYYSTTPEEDSAYSAAIQKMRALIDHCMQQQPEFLQKLQGEGATEFQRKVSIFGLFFAGTETTASALNYLVWQLSRHPDLQEAIRRAENKEQALKPVIAETLRLNPSVFIIGRTARVDVRLKVIDQDNEVVCEERLLKGHTLVMLPQVAAQDPIRYPDPREFHPERFQAYTGRVDELPWYPFGGGPHMCVGQNLAIKELEVFASQLVKHFSVTTIHPEVQQQKGKFLLRASPTYVKLTQVDSES